MVHTYSHKGHRTFTDRAFTFQNRSVQYGDALFETIRVVNSQIYFWEPHYLRLMASMRILRMEIPMHFTLEKLREQLEACLQEAELEEKPARIKILVERISGGRYRPDSNQIQYTISAEAIANSSYPKFESKYEVELFKDHKVVPGLLSTLKTTNKLVNILGSIFAEENGFQNCLLVNTDKNVVEALQGNLFLVKGDKIKTPPLSDGCLRGIIRSQLLEILSKQTTYAIEEASISPFELQKADELFITNTHVGIQPITKYRKKMYAQEIAGRLQSQLVLKANQSLMDTV